MKEIWTQDPEKMAGFVNTLIERKINLTFSQKSLTPQKVIANSLEIKKNITLIVLNKVEEFQCEKNEPVFLLIRLNAHLTFIFQSVVLQEDATTITIPMPQVIFSVQLRKYPRIETPANSTIIFTPHGGTKVCSGELKDISLEGAFCFGNFSPNFAKKDQKLSHVTLRLTMKTNLMPEAKVLIPTAKIMRVVETPGKIGLGLFFIAEGDHLLNLENYLENRAIEESLNERQ